jgi:squalene-associated FAD-dependent desaturase
MGRALAGRVDGGHTVRQWLLQHHQTPRLIELLWEPLALAALNQPIDVAGAASFREVLRRMFSRDRRDSTLGLPLVPLDELYAGPARDFIDAHGGNVETGAPARIVADAGGPGLAIHVKDRELRARAIVCAVPWHALPDVLPPVPALDGVIAAARDTAPSPIVTVNLWFDRPVTTGAFVGLPGRHMQWVFDKRRLLGDGTSHLSLVSSGADAIAARSNAELIDLAMTELAGALPRVAEAVLRRAVVVREKRATFSLAPGAPARPGTRTPVAGLFLAGDWIDTGLPGTIESAVVSGHRAAEAVMKFVK